MFYAYSRLGKIRERRTPRGLETLLSFLFTNKGAKGERFSTYWFVGLTV